MKLGDEEYLSCLAEEDQRLFDQGVDHIKALGRKSTCFAEDGYWPPELAARLRACVGDRLHHIFWISECYYADRIRETDDYDRRQAYIILAYSRVVSLHMLFDIEMGYSFRELSFVLGVIADNADNADTRGDAQQPRVLDLGCGAGSLLAGLAARGYRSLHGTDIAPSSMRVCRERLAAYGLADNIEYATPDDALELYGPESFDVITMGDVLEHIPPVDVDRVLGVTRALLRPGGRLAVVTPNVLSGPHDSTHRFVPTSRVPVGFHLREYSLADLRAVLSRNGFTGFASSGLLPGTTGRSGLPDRISSVDTRLKTLVEPAIRRLPKRQRVPIIEGTYYKGLSAVRP